MEIYTTKCKIDSQWEFGIRLSEFKPGFSNILDGGWGGTCRDGEGGERGHR